jgi:hypothetical protein
VYRYAICTSPYSSERHEAQHPGEVKYVDTQFMGGLNRKAHSSRSMYRTIVLAGLQPGYASPLANRARVAAKRAAAHQALQQGDMGAVFKAIMTIRVAPSIEIRRRATAALLRVLPSAGPAIAAVVTAVTPDEPASEVGDGELLLDDFASSPQGAASASTAAGPAEPQSSSRAQFWLDDPGLAHIVSKMASEFGFTAADYPVMAAVNAKLPDAANRLDLICIAAAAGSRAPLRAEEIATIRERLLASLAPQQRRALSRRALLSLLRHVVCRHFRGDKEVVDAILGKLVSRFVESERTRDASATTVSLTVRAALEAARVAPGSPHALTLLRRALAGCRSSSGSRTVFRLARAAAFVAAHWNVMHVQRSPTEGGVPSSGDWDIVVDCACFVLSNLEATVLGAIGRTWSFNDLVQCGSGLHALLTLVDELRRGLTCRSGRLKADVLADVEFELDHAAFRNRESFAALMTAAACPSQWSRSTDVEACFRLPSIVLALTAGTGIEARMLSKARSLVESSDLVSDGGVQRGRCESSIALQLLASLGRTIHLPRRDVLQPSLVAALRRSSCRRYVTRMLRDASAHADPNDAFEACDLVLASILLPLSTVPRSAGAPSAPVDAVVACLAETLQSLYRNATEQSNHKAVWMREALKLLAHTMQFYGDVAHMPAPAEGLMHTLEESLHSAGFDGTADHEAQSRADLPPSLHSLPLRALPYMLSDQSVPKALRDVAFALVNGHSKYLTPADCAAVVRALATVTAASSVNENTRPDERLKTLRAAVLERVNTLLKQPTWTSAHVTLLGAVTAEPLTFGSPPCHSAAAAAFTDLPRGAMVHLSCCMTLGGFLRAAEALEGALPPHVLASHLLGGGLRRVWSASVDTGDSYDAYRMLALLVRLHTRCHQTAALQSYEWTHAVAALIPAFERPQVLRTPDAVMMLDVVTSALVRSRRELVAVMAPIVTLTLYRSTDFDVSARLVAAVAAVVPLAAESLVLATLTRVQPAQYAKHFSAEAAITLAIAASRSAVWNVTSAAEGARPAAALTDSFASVDGHARKPVVSSLTLLERIRLVALLHRAADVVGESSAQLAADVLLKLSVPTAIQDFVEGLPAMTVDVSAAVLDAFAAPPNSVASDKSTSLESALPATELSVRLWLAALQRATQPSALSAISALTWVRLVLPGFDASGGRTRQRMLLPLAIRALHAATTPRPWPRSAGRLSSTTSARASSRAFRCFVPLRTRIRGGPSTTSVRASRRR